MDRRKFVGHAGGAALALLPLPLVATSWKPVARVDTSAEVDAYLARLPNGGWGLTAEPTEAQGRLERLADGGIGVVEEANPTASVVLVDQTSVYARI